MIKLEIEKGYQSSFIAAQIFIRNKAALYPIVQDIRYVIL